jgi:hypothetical protein
MKDKNGINLRVGDIVHDKWGFDLRVCYCSGMGWYGMLVDDNNSCRNIPYALNSNDIEKK